MAGRFFERVRAGLKHAFAVEDPSAQFSSEDRALLERLAGGIVKRGLAVPAVMFLESVRPLNFIGSQAMVFFNPILSLVMNTKDFERMAIILEKRNSVGLLIDMIEKAEREKKDVKTRQRCAGERRNE